MEIRTLRSKDIFEVINLIEELDLTDTLEELMGGLDAESGTFATGSKIVSIVLRSVLPKIKTHKIVLNEFLGGLVNKTADEMDDMSMVQYAKLLRGFFTHQDIKDSLEVFYSSQELE